MPRPRIDMRKIREVLRLTLGEELSRRQVSAASGVPLTTVNDYLRRAAWARRRGPVGHLGWRDASSGLKCGT